MKKDTSALDLFLIPALRDLSDPDYQARIWLRGEGPESDSYEEAIASFLDICELALSEAEESGGLREEDAELLGALYQKIDEYDESIGDSEIINIQAILSYSKWHKIQKLALQAYHALQKP